MTTTWYSFGELTETAVTPSVMEDVLDRAEEARAALRETSVIEVVNVLDAVADDLSEKDDPIRRQAIETMPGLIGFSPAMVEAGVDTLADMLKRENLERRLYCDLGDPAYLDMFVHHERFEGAIRAEPRGVVAHVAAGNVFVGAVDSLVQGLVTKNVNILKMSGQDPVFPVLFAKALKRRDPGGRVAGALALVPFRGGDREIEDIVKKRSEVVVVYGGPDAVAAYRDGLGPHTRLVEYGPKYSCAVIEGVELDRIGLDAAARDMARDATMWEQSACSSPHTVFVEGVERAERFADAVAKSLADWAETYPHGEIYRDEKVEITRARELALVEEALDNGRLLIPARDDQDWTVIFEKAATFRVSCHHRCLFVKPVETLDQVVEVLTPYGQFVQSVGMLVSPATRYRLAEKLSFMGADRITELGHMARRKHGTPHDGTRGTAELVRWVSIGHKDRFVDEFDFLPDEKRDQYTLVRLNRLLKHARAHSPFYRERLPETPLKSLAELGELPVLTQGEFRSHLPPGGGGLLSAPLKNSYAFGSGGTTGAPKFVYRTVPETLRNARALAKGLYLSILDEDDVVANLLYAGNMWASFVSYNQTLERVGCEILPIAGNIGMDNILAYVKAFRPTAVISIPSCVISLAERIEAEKLDVKIPKIITGGEHLFAGARKYLRGVLGVEKFASTGYTTNDTGAIGFQCEVCGGPAHHVHEDVHVVEIVDPDTYQPVPDGQVGKVVVTNIDRLLMPMVRYDVGDMGRIIPERCSCGRTVRLMELLGRSDEGLNIGGATIKLDMIAHSVAAVEELSFHFRMIAREEGVKDQLVIEVETREEVDEGEVRRLEKKLLKTILDDKPEQKGMIEAGYIAPTLIRVLPPNALPRNSRTGKIKQTVDERKAGT